MKTKSKKFFIGGKNIRTEAANKYVEDMSAAMKPICDKMKKNGWNNWQIGIAINQAAHHRDAFFQLGLE